ncbi:uncharacterized protein LOC126232433 [Schistocerca nitens]|uniref:uncharacterized protein LOC126232433 n=1 Tax=Schistocerca nitens TaxID=7011 RepID=UPI002117A064|nr:uncharacterized protein LOC126232433 [Schistocerca nitens]
MRARRRLAVRSVRSLQLSYLQHRTFAVRVDDALSTARPICAGVPQGSVLGPVLYTLYTSDLPTPPRVEKAIYADDTMLFTRSRWRDVMRPRLQSACNLLEEWATNWRIRFNPAKTQGSDLSVENGLLIYRMYIRPLIDYACEVWGNAARTHLQRLQSLQNKILRRVFHVHPQFPHQYLHEAAEEPEVLQRHQEIARRFYEKATMSTNPLIRGLGEEPDPHDRYRRPIALLAR